MSEFGIDAFIHNTHINTLKHDINPFYIPDLSSIGKSPLVIQQWRTDRNMSLLKSTMHVPLYATKGTPVHFQICISWNGIQTNTAEKREKERECERRRERERDEERDKERERD